MKGKKKEIELKHEKKEEKPQKTKKEIHLLEKHRKIFACKYLCKGIIKQIIRAAFAVPGIYKIRNRKKYNLKISELDE